MSQSEVPIYYSANAMENISQGFLLDIPESREISLKEHSRI